MLIKTDDEVYRVNAIWLGPPNATFPWRARYASYGVGALAFVVIMFVQRRLGIPLDFFSVAWALLLAVGAAKLIGRRIGHERPLGSVIASLIAEIRTPRRATKPTGGAMTARTVRVRRRRPTPPAPHEKGTRR